MSDAFRPGSRVRENERRAVFIDNRSDVRDDARRGVTRRRIGMLPDWREHFDDGLPTHRGLTQMA